MDDVSHIGLVDSHAVGLRCDEHGYLIPFERGSELPLRHIPVAAIPTAWLAAGVQPDISAKLVLKCTLEVHQTPVRARLRWVDRLREQDARVRFGTILSEEAPLRDPESRWERPKGAN